jgi:cysteine desulfurase
VRSGVRGRLCNVPTYLDCNATTPLDPEVREVVLRHMDEEFGNAGSRTHIFGTRAKQAVERARDQVAAVVAAKRDEVVFTSGATESNNLAILGLADFGRAKGRTHVISTAIEHKAVLEPMEALGAAGFEVELVKPNEGGWVSPEDIAQRLRPETLLVSVMHVNNETGVVQPIAEIAGALEGSAAYLHVDAAQGFGKDVDALRNPRIELISISGHKLYAPKGVGALITRRRGYERAPLKALAFGGGQERGLRPGTLPVHLIAGLGMAAELALRDGQARTAKCSKFKQRMWAALEELEPAQNGDPNRCLFNSVNLSFLGIDAEAAMVAVKDLIAISNGSACTSSDYKPSHVLSAMGLPEARIRTAVRISWCHLTPDPDWRAVVSELRRIRVQS